MKKTYKTFNGENRNSFFRVGKTLIKARFTPTYTTDNGIMQKAIEDTYAFKVGEIQLVTPSMTWIKIKKMKRTIIYILEIAFLLLCHYWGCKKAYVKGYKQAIKDEIEYLQSQTDSIKCEMFKPIEQ